MGFLLVVAALIVIGAVALVLVGRIGSDDLELPDAPLDLRPVESAAGQFDVVLRGYRMDEVDERIAQLEAEVAALKTAEGQ